ncbi:hypothetical protein Trydic_g5902, partial [Trypoxylus dichotomus]
MSVPLIVHADNISRSPWIPLRFNHLQLVGETIRNRERPTFQTKSDRAMQSWRMRVDSRIGATYRIRRITTQTCIREAKYSPPWHRKSH